MCTQECIYCRRFKCTIYYISIYICIYLIHYNHMHTHVTHTVFKSLFVSIHVHIIYIYTHIYTIPCDAIPIMCNKTENFLTVTFYLHSIIKLCLFTDTRANKCHNFLYKRRAKSNVKNLYKRY